MAVTKNEGALAATIRHITSLSVEAILLIWCNQVRALWDKA